MLRIWFFINIECFIILHKCVLRLHTLNVYINLPVCLLIYYVCINPPQTKYIISIIILLFSNRLPTYQ